MRTVIHQKILVMVIAQYKQYTQNMTLTPVIAKIYYQKKSLLDNNIQRYIYAKSTHRQSNEMKN